MLRNVSNQRPIAKISSLDLGTRRPRRLAWFSIASVSLKFSKQPSFRPINRYSHAFSAGGVGPAGILFSLRGTISRSKSSKYHWGVFAGVVQC